MVNGCPGCTPGGIVTCIDCIAIAIGATCAVIAIIQCIAMSNALSLRARFKAEAEAKARIARGVKPRQDPPRGARVSQRA